MRSIEFDNNYSCEYEKDNFDSACKHDTKLLYSVCSTRKITAYSREINLNYSLNFFAKPQKLGKITFNQTDERILVKSLLPHESAKITKVIIAI